MVILGTLIGAFWFYFGDAPAFIYVMETPWWKLLLIMLLGCLMFPTPPSLDIRGWSEINSLNGAAWSLMWEYVTNILYAVLIRRFTKVALTLFVAASSLFTIDICFNLDLFGLLKVREYAAYTVIGGFGLSADQIYIGVGRLLFPFFGGLLIYRLNLRLRISRQGFLMCSLAMAVILGMPHLGGDTPNWINGAYCAFVIMMLFPMIVMTGAGSPLEGRKTIAVCKFLGEISYPLYITHYPMIYVMMKWSAEHAYVSTGTHVWVCMCIFLASIAVAYASLKVYDIPVRKWLTEHWK